jgi:FMN phosphatase YigB (HAD superfamily)
MTLPELLVLFDVDNTLLDNDAFSADLDRCLGLHLGKAGRARYWQVYEALRAQYGYVDYLGTLQRLRDEGLDTAALADIAARLLDYPFEERAYPDALAAVAHVAALAPVAILSDGDIVFQPRKIRRSGLEQAFAGQVLVCVHKERQVEELKERFPARHYALVDDKPALLQRMKARLGDDLTTIWVRQGHYAREAGAAQLHPAPDLSIDAIAQLCQLQRCDFHAGASASATT